jgi:LCP family protein required for cell wall assembly
MGVTIVAASLVLAMVAGVAAYAIIVNNQLGTDIAGNKADFKNNIWDGTFKEPEKPEDPFWMLLMGTDDRDGYEIPRTDTLILCHVDQKNSRVAMISIPRDTYVNIPGYGYGKINAAYTWAEVEKEGTGAQRTIQTVSEFAGIDIAYFAQINFNGLQKLVDDLGGVEVDVPVDIVNDPDASDGRGLEIYQGYQKLDGEKALVFCRARNNFDAGDYQRQANQRTFLQALARQILASDPVTIATTVNNAAKMTFTNMDLAKIIKIAQSMQGMKENAIHTYHVPSEPKDKDDVSYVMADDAAWNDMIQSIDHGIYPDYQEDDLWSGVVPDNYIAGSGNGSATAADAPDFKTGNYTIDVRNGSGVDGSATATSDLLSLAGYKRGEIGNAGAYVYDDTLIVYKDEYGRTAAEDIRRRLGYGRTLAANGNYQFTGDVLVIVGGDFKG